MTKARRQELILAWGGIAFATSMVVALEVVLLGDTGPFVAVITTTLALVVGIWITRRALMPHKRASITVDALRGRERRGLGR